MLILITYYKTFSNETQMYSLEQNQKKCSPLLFYHTFKNSAERLQIFDNIEFEDQYRLHSFKVVSNPYLSLFIFLHR